MQESSIFAGIVNVLQRHFFSVEWSFFTMKWAFFEEDKKKSVPTA